MNDYYADAKRLFEYTQTIRRDLHRHPELGFHETRTSTIIARELRGLGLEVATGIAETGVVALLNGGKPGSTILVRADIDALPITEQNEVEFRSQNDGVMHACGHDGHIAMALTIARILSEHREELAGIVKFVFQPAEELLSGAKRMIEEGVLENPKPKYALAMHLWNEAPVGWVGVSAGPITAGADSFRVRIKGKGGHGGLPHQSKDPILAAAQVIVALQSIVSRDIDAQETAVISVTTVRGGETFNVIPSEVELLGTIRTYKPSIRSIIIERFKQISECISASMGCSADVEINYLTPSVINDPDLAAQVQKKAHEIFPTGTVDTEFRIMASEDMAYMMEKVPGCYFYIGSNNPKKGLDAAHHDPHFNFDEEALPHGIALMSALIVELLRDQ